MRITFDAAKDKANVLKHGLRLEFGATVIENAMTTMLDTRFDYGEERYVSFGYVEKRLYVCVYAVRDDEVRIISVRKANDREVRRYG